MKQEESLNAFKFVVVPVLKRVIPVAAVGARRRVAGHRIAEVLAGQAPAMALARNAARA